MQKNRVMKAANSRSPLFGTVEPSGADGRMGPLATPAGGPSRKNRTKQSWLWRIHEDHTGGSVPGGSTVDSGDREEPAEDLRHHDLSDGDRRGHRGHRRVCRISSRRCRPAGTKGEGRFLYRPGSSGDRSHRPVDAVRVSPAGHFGTSLRYSCSPVFRPEGSGSGAGLLLVLSNGAGRDRGRGRGGCAEGVHEP